MLRNAIGGAALLALLTLTGCTTQPGPAPEDPQQVYVDTSANLGDTICAIVSTSDDPDQMLQASRAAAAAKAVLESPSPSLTALQAALSDGMPRSTARWVAISIRSIRRQLGTTDILVKGSLAYDMAAALIEACQAVLGETAMLELSQSIAEMRLPEFPPGAPTLARSVAPPPERRS